MGVAPAIIPVTVIHANGNVSGIALVFRPSYNYKCTVCIRLNLQSIVVDRLLQTDRLTEKHGGVVVDR